MKQIEETIQWLFENDAKEMKKICNKEMMRFGGISGMDYDDFYSQVGWDVSLARDSFNPSKGKTFKEYVCGVIKLSVCKEMKRRNRGKRQIIIEKEVTDSKGNTTIVKEYIPTVSLDAPVGEDSGNTTVGDTIVSDKTIEKELFEEENKEEWRKEVKEYLAKLSPLQRQIAFLLSDKNTPEEICEELHITMKHFKNSMKRILADERIRPLRALI